MQVKGQVAKKITGLVDTAGYDNKRPSYYQNARLEMLKYIPQAATSVLEIGCGSGEFAAVVKEKRSIVYTAVEPFLAAAEKARGRVDRLLECPIDEALVALAGQRFDCIVVNDVLEHLVDPWAIVRSMRAMLEPGGVVVASIPNIRYFPALKALVMQGEWQYQDHGVLDRTHLRFFTRSAIHHLFSANQYEVLVLEGINSIQLPWKFGLLNKVLGRRFDDARHMQFACVAQEKRSKA